MSVNTPSFTTSPEICALAGGAASPRPSNMAPTATDIRILAFLLVFRTAVF
jgi:hypothetical protein